MNPLVIFILILIGVSVIEALVIVIMAFVIKAKKEKKIVLDNQAMLNVDRLRKEMEKKVKVYNEKINKANNINDYVHIYNDIMSNQADNNS